MLFFKPPEHSSKRYNSFSFPIGILKGRAEKNDKPVIQNLNEEFSIMDDHKAGKNDGDLLQ